MNTAIKAVLLGTVVFSISTVTALADYSLNILHINDLHSRIESINKYDSTCSAEDEGKGECFGGVARLITAIGQTRQSLDGQNVLLLNAGDNFQGSLFYTTYKGLAEAEFLNLMKFDAMTVGNHEFDDSEDGLAGFLDKVEFPVVTANVLAGYSSKLGDRIKPSIVLEIGGQKIGIVGAVANDTPELSSPGPNVMISEDVEAISAEVAKLKAEGVNKIIALTHVGYPRDLAAIAKIPDVDVVVGGHSHSLLSNTDEKAEGPYPTMVDNPGGYMVPVVQAGSYSKYLGDLNVVFDDNGVVKQASGDPILLDAKFKPDEAALARIKELAGPIEELRNKNIGESTAAIDGSRDVCRAMECSMGNLVADAMVDRVKDQGVTIAIQNGGGLRASIDAGPVSMGEVLTVLPFQNTLATFQLKGSDVVAALESGLGKIEEGAGRFPQVSGLSYAFDASKPAGERVSDVMVKDGDSYAPIDPDKMYGVATNNFMRGGGDGYSIFKTAGVNAYDYGPGLEQVVADYVTANSPYTPYTDGRIKAVAMAAATPAAEPAAAPAAEPAAPAAAEKPAMAPAAETTAAPAASEPVKVPEPMAGSADIMSTAPTITAEPMAKPAEEMAPKTDMAMEKGTHVIAAGDTLWDIAKQAYGDPTMWKKISKANPGAKIHALTIGETLTVPAQ